MSTESKRNGATRKAARSALRVTRQSDAARTKSNSNAVINQAMRWTLGSRPNANSHNRGWGRRRTTSGIHDIRNKARPELRPHSLGRGTRTLTRDMERWGYERRVPELIAYRSCHVLALSPALLSTVTAVIGSWSP